jgi:hypothetical protein
MTSFFFFQLNPYGHNPCVTSSLTRGWDCLFWICLAFVKCTCRTYSMILKILPFTVYTHPLTVQALQCRSWLSYLRYATAGSSVVVCVSIVAAACVCCRWNVFSGRCLATAVSSRSAIPAFRRHVTIYADTYNECLMSHCIAIRELTFCWRWKWRLLSCGMWRRVVW